MDTTESMMNRLNMVFKKNRKESFKQWPFSDKDACSIENMAEAGFYWTGTNEEQDSAQCFVCNKPLDGWEATDNPWSEHEKHAPKCPFVVLGKNEDDLTLEQLVDLWKIMTRNIANSMVGKCEKQIADQCVAIKEEMLKFKKDSKRRK